MRSGLLRAASIAGCIGWLAALAGCGGHGAAQPGSGSVTDPTTSSIAATIRDGDWPTFDYNAERTGVGPVMTGITASKLGRLKRRVVHLDGTVDSAPIQAHGVVVDGRARDVVIVTTTYGKTIAIDPGTGAKLWEFTPAAIGSYVGSGQVTTTTPVLDPGRRYVYAASPDGLIHKLALATGRQVRSGGWPARVTFDPTREKLAGALNIAGTSVVVVTGGYIGDIPVYQGHVVLIDRASGRITAVFNTLCSNRRALIDPPSSCHQSDSAIWARVGSVVEPGAQRLLVATGNANFNGATDWGDSVLELSSTKLALLANWTPSDQATLNSSDADLGSTAPALLPETGGLRLAVQGGKAGKLSLLDLTRLDGTAGDAGPRTGGELQDISSPGGGAVLTAPAVWTAEGRTYVFVADDSGTAGYQLDGDHSLRFVWQNGTPGTSPVIAGGLLYIYDELDGKLIVRDPASGRQLAALAAGTGHWNSPIVIGGRIVLPEGSYHTNSTTGVLDIYHLPGR